MLKKTIGIREMAEFVGRSGSITNQFTLSVRALEGTRLHVEYQNRQPTGYCKEVTILTTLELYDYEITFHGRMDGLYEKEGRVTIEELKSTYIHLEDIEEAVNPAHYNQLVCYGYLYCRIYHLQSVDLNLVYIYVPDSNYKKIHFHYSVGELEEIFMHIFLEYKRFLDYEEKTLQVTKDSIAKLEFPYKVKRKGQSEMMNAVFSSIKQQRKLFIQASTGSGKTLGVLYPAFKAFYKEYTDKILYLTAKTITRTVAVETVHLCFKKGLKMNTVVINSKDSMCFLDKRECNPKTCLFANHYYRKVNDALYDALNHESFFEEENIKRYAKKYEICPFEFSLDLSDFCSLMIMDYNYVFDPRVSLERLTTHDYHLTLLIDEAHNLIDRSREMYSAALFYDACSEAKKVIEGKDSKLTGMLAKIERFFLDSVVQLEGQDYVIMGQPPMELIEIVSAFFNEAFDYLQEKGNEEDAFMEFFFECSRFRSIYELYDDCYRTYMIDDPLSIKLYCIDPTDLLVQKYKQCTSTILFSATLLPITYFYSILGGNDQDKKIYFPSHFDIQRRKIFIGQDVDTRYHRRIKSLNKICQYIYRFTSKRKGNYLVLFPSYEYMNQVYTIMLGTYNLVIHKQENNMTISQREDFLALFDRHDTTQIFFGILGGLFGEGIDLKGEMLIGCIIVGVGLPQLSLERDLIRDYYGNHGFDYSYRYPGFNKVLQGAGRVIRNETDYGAILLLDDRYLNSEYTDLYPIEWQNCNLTDIDHIAQQIDEFWKSIDE